METSIENLLWSKKIIQLLIELGVENFCVAPGSRSTPLTTAVAENSHAKNFVHFDERGLGFFALGLAKAAKKPVALITTSGTAVANLLPSVIEAYQSKIPLILLTSDRSFEEKDNGSNQTIEQLTCFSSFTNWQFNMPCPESRIGDDFIQSAICYAVFMAKKNSPAPVQINCQFRKPLYSSSKPDLQIPRSTVYFEEKQTLASSVLESLRDILLHSKKGLIVCAKGTCFSSISKLAKKLNWPVYLDISSDEQVKDDSIMNDLVIQNFAHMIDSLSNEKFDCILHFGNHLVIEEKMKKLQTKHYILVSNHSKRHDPFFLVTHRVCACIPSFCDEMASCIPQKEKLPFLETIQEHDKKISQDLELFFEKQTLLTEPLIFYELSKVLNSSTNLFIGNSMPIRYANWYLRVNHPIQVFSNRGASGIDGNIATACGIAAATNKPLIAIIGDMTFLHDLNSLALLKTTPLTLFVSNNGGGNISSFLPIAKQVPYLDKFFTISHDYEFKEIASFFDLSYEKISTLSEWKAFTKKRPLSSQIVEIKTSKDINVQVQTELVSMKFSLLTQEKLLDKV